MSVIASPTKTQFYNPNGAGRDSYIYGNNGGFCPAKEPCKIEELGKSAALQTKLQLDSIIQYVSSAVDC